jgi:hypothetical protein
MRASCGMARSKGWPVVACWMGADGDCVWGVFWNILEKLFVVGGSHSAVEIGHISEPTTLFEQTLSNHRNRLDKGRPGNVYGGCHCIELSKRTLKKGTTV